MVRVKHRYLLVDILYPDNSSTTSSKPHAQLLPDIIHFHQPTPDSLTPQLLARGLREQIALLYGDYGAGVTNNGLTIKYLSPATSTAIIRCSRDNYRLVWAALTFMTHLPAERKEGKGRPCVIQVVRVSGTIRKAEEEAIRRAKGAILKAKREAGESEMEGLDAFLGRGEDEVGSNVGAGHVGQEEEDVDEEVEDGESDG